MPGVDRDSPQRQPDGDNAQASSGEGISQFIAKVLDQLSVTAWLPATMLVGNAAVLLALHNRGDLRLTDAIGRVTASPLGLLIASFIAIVLATMVSQAFAFETIRILEGYWGKYRPLQFMTVWRSSRHFSRLEKLEKRRKEYAEKAFEKSVTGMLRAGVPRVLINIQQDRVYRRPRDPQHSDDAIAEAEEQHNSWYSYCPPSWSRRLEALDNQLKQYPSPSRILPTRLGNTLRSWEDELTLPPNEDLEGMILRGYDRIPVYLQVKHDQFRNRLDMYCTLAFVFFTLAIMATILLSQGKGGWLAGTLVGAFYFGLAWMSYEAAISSARGYGSVLLAINQRDITSGNAS